MTWKLIQLLSTKRKLLLYPVIVLRAQIAFIAKWLRRCVLTKINSVTVGSRMTPV